MKNILVPTVVALACGLALAKLPPPDDAAKAKAAETAAKAAWQAKVDAFQLCKVQDKIAGAYMKTAKAGPARPRAAAAPAAPAPTAAAPAPTAAAPAASAPAPAVAAPSGATAVAAAQPASGTTPVAFKPPPPCADPGPFAYNPPEQKPLESAGAHSPSATADSPPSGKTPAAEIAPKK